MKNLNTINILIQKSLIYWLYAWKFEFICIILILTSTCTQTLFLGCIWIAEKKTPMKVKSYCNQSTGLHPGQ